MKKTITTIAMTTIFTFGATFANAGILVGDRGTTPTQTCSAKDGILVGDRGIVGGVIEIFESLTGILVGDKTDNPTPCASRDGILVGD